MVAAKVGPNGKQGEGFVYHLIVSDRPACGIRARGVEVQVVPDTRQPAEKVPGNWRCQRPACRALWP